MISIKDMNVVRALLDRTPTTPEEDRAIENLFHSLAKIVGASYTETEDLDADTYEAPAKSSASLARFDASSALEKIEDIFTAFSTVDMTVLGMLDLDDLISVRRMWLAAQTTRKPDQWHERQVAEACAGRAPRWFANGQPMYG